jgi:hypothetical protein
VCERGLPCGGDGVFGVCVCVWVGGGGGCCYGARADGLGVG